MLTLFRCATLASWKKIYDINYFGCDRFNGGIYHAVGADDDEYVDRAARLAALAAATDDDDADPWTHFAFRAGDARFPAWECSTPEAAPVSIALFMFSYSILTAFVILSLFIGVITMGMMLTMDEDKAATKDVVYEERLRRNNALFNNEGGERDAQERSDLKDKLDSAYGRPREVNARDGCIQPWLCGAMGPRYLRLAFRAEAIVASPGFNAAVVGAILVVAVSVGLQTDLAADHPMMGALDVLDGIVLAIFTAESTLKVGVVDSCRASEIRRAVASFIQDDCRARQRETVTTVARRRTARARALSFSLFRSSPRARCRTASSSTRGTASISSSSRRATSRTCLSISLCLLRRRRRRRRRRRCTLAAAAAVLLCPFFSLACALTRCETRRHRPVEET